MGLGGRRRRAPPRVDIVPADSHPDGYATAMPEAPTAESAITELTADSLDRTLGTGGLAAVEFSAPWCAACAAMEPALQDVAGRHAPRIRTLRVDVDKLRPAAERFAIAGLPTLVFLRDGREVKRVVGRKTKRELAILYGELV